MKVSKSPLRAGGASGCFPRITSPVDPFSDSQSPSFSTLSPIATDCKCRHTKVRKHLNPYNLVKNFKMAQFILSTIDHFLSNETLDEDVQTRTQFTFSASFTRTLEHPETQHFPQPRATTAAWEVMPPLAVRIPTAACMPPTSSGLVSVLTYIFGKEKKSQDAKVEATQYGAFIRSSKKAVSDKWDFGPTAYNSASNYHNMSSK